jgi:hypothetical protein
MRRIIQQSIVLPAPAEMLFGMYLDPTAHVAITGRPVTIPAEEGSDFRAFDDQLSGMLLALVNPRLIVHSRSHGRLDEPQAACTTLKIANRLRVSFPKPFHSQTKVQRSIDAASGTRVRQFSMREAYEHFGSIVVRFGPLRRLQRRHASARFSASSEPPC